MSRHIKFVLQMFNYKKRVFHLLIKSASFQLRSTKNHLRIFYHKLPPRLKTQIFKLQLNGFNHWVYEGYFLQKTPNIIGDLLDLRQIPDNPNITPSGVAIHCHIFYSDLIKEFRGQLARLPFTADVFVSVATQEAALSCKHEFGKLNNVGKLIVKVVPNRGRDIAPMFVEFGSQLKSYNFIAHIQSKKSVYNNGGTLGWREYLLNSLFGSSSNIRRVFSLFAQNPQVGIIYPQLYHMLPYQACTWLANQADGLDLCTRMGIKMPDDYFNFPAGSMFWARIGALKPLFDLNLKWEDFPEEKGQTDGTIAHAIERLLGVIPTALGFRHCIIKDMQIPSWSTYRFDQQYLSRSQNSYNFIWEDTKVKVIAFDVFDTLLVRPLLKADHTKKIISLQLIGKLKEAFINYRSMAEVSMRCKKGRDVDLTEIYEEFAKLAGLTSKESSEIRSLEEQVEIASVSARPEVVALLEKAKASNKRIVLISDMFLKKSTVETMLNNNGIRGWDKIYLSSDKGVRKDSGALYELMLKEEGIEARDIYMIGDNERSDFQLPNDNFGIYSLHVLRSISLASSLPTYLEHIARVAHSDDINDELTFGLLVRQNLNKIGNFDSNNTNLFSNDPKQLGFNVLGPVILSFCQWLFTQAKADKIERLYFLSREGKLIKRVYDAWTASISNAPKSYYLQVSRRAVSVPNITSFEYVKKIAQTYYHQNKIHLFLYERFGLQLSDQDWDYIFTNKLWKKNELISINEGDICRVEPLLKFLLPKLLVIAKNERHTIMCYLKECGFAGIKNKAVVDVGYSGTIQKALKNLLSEPVHGYYLATSNQIYKNMPSQTITKGCYVDQSYPNFVSSSILTHSFTLEKLLSAHETQIIKYVVNSAGELEPCYKSLGNAERMGASVRDELQLGCMEYVEQAVNIRDNLLSQFTPSLVVANQIYTNFIMNNSKQKNMVIQKLILDDAYCGRDLL